MVEGRGAWRGVPGVVPGSTASGEAWHLAEEGIQHAFSIYGFSKGHLHTRDVSASGGVWH